jgi:ligand-binding sensor domain-containing protein/signal transduction histidine kinase
MLLDRFRSGWIPCRPALTVAGLAVLFLASSAAWAQEEGRGTQYRYDVWKTEQGLPQNSVKSILQTKDGYLWFSTRFGVVRFDGVAFRVFDRFNTPELSYDNCVALAEDQRDGSLWLATMFGVVRYKDQSFKSYRLCTGEGMDRIWSICASAEGGVWVAANSSLQRFNAEKVTRYTVEDGLHGSEVGVVLEDEQKMLWIGTRSGVERRDPVTGRFTEIWRSRHPETESVSCLFKDRSGVLWAGSASSGLVRWQDGKATAYTMRDGLPDNRVDTITEDQESNLWLSTGNGKLLRFRDGKFTQFGRKDGLSDDWVLCLREDREGNLWVGTAFGGLNRMQPRRIVGYSVKDGLGSPNVWSIFEGRNSTLWMGTDGGLARFSKGKFTNFRLGDDATNNIVKAVREDRTGTVWAGTKEAGLKRFRNGRITHYGVADGLTHFEIHALYEDRAGSLWIGTRLGLSVLKEGTIIRKYTTQNGLSTNDVRCIFEDRSGDIWIGTYGGGLNRLRDERFTAFTTRDGLSDNFAWTIYEDADGVLWIGTERGLTRLENGKFAAFTTNEGLFDNVVNDILEDDRNNLWLSCNRGIYRIRKQELNDVAAGKARSVHYVSYGTADGMPSSETNGENQPTACKTSAGMLWFPTTDGVVTIDPGKIPNNELPPPVVLETVILDGESLLPHQPVRLPAGRGDVIEFRYTANSLVAPDKVLFQYCLDGCDKDWRDAGTRRVAFYTNLRPGNYTFRVKACNNHGVWNDKGAAFSFYLAPHFYQTYPFYGLCALSAILAGYGLHRLRLNVVRKIERLKRQHALEKERSRIANEMHDDLGSSLTQIALLGELARRELPYTDRAGDHIRKITTTAREVFRAMDEIVWAVNPRKDTVDSLVGYLCKYAQDFLRPADIRCRLDLPEILPACSLSTEERHNVFLVFKEALNNIVKHAAATEVWIRVTVGPSSCIIVVEDNGRGFSSDSARPDGNGLHNMKERLTAISGRLELRSQPGQGTTLQMVVLLRQPKEHPTLN